MLSGGYYDKKYWTTEEGWRFAQYKTNVLKMPWPTFWYPTGTKLDSLDELTNINHENEEQYNYYCGMSYPQPTAAILEGTSSVKEANSNAVTNNNNNNNTSHNSPIVAPDESSNLSTPRISTSGNAIYKRLVNLVKLKQIQIIMHLSFKIKLLQQQQQQQQQQHQSQQHLIVQCVYMG
eukprot:UN00974